MGSLALFSLRMRVNLRARALELISRQARAALYIMVCYIIVHNLTALFKK